MSAPTPPIQFPAERIVRQPAPEPETLNTVTSLDIPADRVLNAAVDAGLQHVIIAGYLPDGSEYFASSTASAPECLWMLERAKAELLLDTAG